MCSTFTCTSHANVCLSLPTLPLFSFSLPLLLAVIPRYVDVCYVFFFFFLGGHGNSRKWGCFVQFLIPFSLLSAPFSWHSRSHQKIALFFRSPFFPGTGFGRVLFDHMLVEEKIHPYKLAVDKPSKKCFGFLAKHYGLKDYRPCVSH